jgi:hypothetical protein
LLQQLTEKLFRSKFWKLYPTKSLNVLSQCVNVVSQGENVAKEELFPWVFEFETHWCDHFKLLITFLGLHSDKEKDKASEEI